MRFERSEAYLTVGELEPKAEFRIGCLENGHA
jgi:hypothetical protein